MSRSTQYFRHISGGWYLETPAFAGVTASWVTDAGVDASYVLPAETSIQSPRYFRHTSGGWYPEPPVLPSYQRRLVSRDPSLRWGDGLLGDGRWGDFR